MRRKLLVVLLLAVIMVIAVPQIVLARNHSNAHDDSGEHGDSDHGAIAVFNVRLTGSEQVPAVKRPLLAMRS